MVYTLEDYYNMVHVVQARGIRLRKLEVLCGTKNSSRLKNASVVIYVQMAIFRDSFVWRLAVPFEETQVSYLCCCIAVRSTEVIAGSQARRRRAAPFPYSFDADRPCSRHAVALYNARLPRVRLVPGACRLCSRMAQARLRSTSWQRRS